MTTVVDASVVLAWLQDEPGAVDAEPMLMEGLIGAANWSEVLQKTRQHGARIGIVARLLTSFGLRVGPVTAEDAEIAATLWREGSRLSLADRLCLALGLRSGHAVATADAAWSHLEHGPSVVVIR
ncbi:MAG: PIN domain-containing protein [Chloroflexota bacterium]